MIIKGAHFKKIERKALYDPEKGDQFLEEGTDEQKYDALVHRALKNAFFRHLNAFEKTPRDKNLDQAKYSINKY